MRAIHPLLLALLLLAAAPRAAAHSGKARFHVVVDTDGAADDLRALALLLGNREAEVLAVVSSEGALPPCETAERVAALLRSLHHEGIPVGAGRALGAPAPAWRAHSRRVDWGGDTPDSTKIHPDDTPGRFPAAVELLSEALCSEEEPVTVLALGSLTNLGDLLRDDPRAARRIVRIVWYDTLPGANSLADTLAARRVLASGLPIAVVSENPACPLAVSEGLLDSIAAIPTPHARKIVDTHRSEPLARLVAARHLRLWDDLAVLYLYAPQLFTERETAPGVRRSLLRADAAPAAHDMLCQLLRGKPDSECRVFYGFPADSGLYAADVAPLVAPALERHGASEWRAAVLTNELHGHLGIYALIGVKMGIRAREYFAIGVDDIAVESFAGRRPPVSCLNDGLQVGAGSTTGHGLLTAAEVDRPRPEALFTFKEKTIRLTLRPEYAARIRRDVQRGIELHGDLTEPYWQYIRALALRYWLEFDRHRIFDLKVEQQPPAGTADFHPPHRRTGSGKCGAPAAKNPPAACSCRIKPLSSLPDSVLALSAKDEMKRESGANPEQSRCCEAPLSFRTSPPLTPVGSGRLRNRSQSEDLPSRFDVASTRGNRLPISAGKTSTYLKSDSRYAAGVCFCRRRAEYRHDLLERRGE